MPLADGPLRRLIETSPLPVHLVTDTDHRSLAASPAREHEWGQTAAGLLGQTLWRFAPKGIQAAEQSLDQHGWWEATCRSRSNCGPAPATPACGSAAK